MRGHLLPRGTTPRDAAKQVAGGLAEFEYLRQHSRDSKLTRALGARGLGRSVSWLAHHLKRSTGQAFQVHRMTADLLMSSSASVKHIAITTGCSSANTMSRLFQRRFGTSPSA